MTGNRISAGEFDTRVRFDRPTYTIDDYGATGAPDWVEVAEVWANVRDQLLYNNGEEAQRSPVRQAIRMTRIRVRYRPDIDSSLRVAIPIHSASPAAERLMQILSVANTPEVADCIDLMCQEFSTTGGAGS